MRQTLTTVLLVVLSATATISFGGVLAETAMLYPNIFRDPPDSLALAREFMVAGSPSDFFPPLGLTTILTGVAAVALTWRAPRVRWWLAGAVAVFVCCEFLFSAWFFWPRNTIMFVDPVGTHPDEYLRTVAAEFEAAHWVRVIGGAVTSALAATGSLAWYRRTLGARAEGAAAGRAA
jgi:hypothetical protein